MMERRQIVQFEQQDPHGVLVTLIHTEGSSYRRPGARLLTGSQSNSYAGTISGGCLETEVVKKARWMVRDGASVERYSMAFDDTAAIPFGLGCGGEVDLLFEPLGTPEANALLSAMRNSLKGIETRVVSFLPGGGRPLRRLVLSDDHQVIFASPSISPEKIACAIPLKLGTHYEGRFVERLQAPQRVFLLGAGDDAKPVAKMASLQGWTIIVADGRPQLARADRFPDAERVLQIDETTDLGITARDAVVLMTHSYEQDRDLLIRTLPAAPRYLGLLGSRHRSSLLASEAAVALGRTLESCCDLLFAPVGMDLGGDGPEAIALAIIAEIQSVCHGRLGSSRRLQWQEVLDQVERGGASRYLQTQCALSVG